MPPAALRGRRLIAGIKVTFGMPMNRLGIPKLTGSISFGLELSVPRETPGTPCLRRFAPHRLGYAFA